jgi:hypothetical protein
MGKIRVAKDGHLYEYRRTYGGRYYTVQHGTGDGSGWFIGIPLFVGVMLAPFTYLLSIPIAALVIVATLRSARRY